MKHILKSVFLTYKKLISKAKASRRSPVSVYFVIGDVEDDGGRVKAEAHVGFCFSLSCSRKKNKMLK